MQKNGKYIRLTYGILLSVMTVIVGCLLIAYVWDIYVSGKAEGLEVYLFSRSRVGERLLKILPALIIWVAMVVIGFVLWEVFPQPVKRNKPDVRYTLYRLKKRMPANAEGDLEQSFKAVNRERLILKILWLAVAVIGAGVAIFTIVYLAIPSNFPAVEDKSEPVFDMVKCVMPAVAAAFACACGVAVYEGISAKKQLEHVRKLTAGVKPVPEKKKKWVLMQEFSYKNEESKFLSFIIKFIVIPILKFCDFVIEHPILVLRIIVGCLGVAFVIAGICNGSMRDMLNKAIRICSECIGLG